MSRLILGTTSVYRREAFDLAGIPYILEDSRVEEYFEDRPDDPDHLVEHLAMLKAEAVAERHESGVIVGFDSVAYFEGVILEKPRCRKEAFDRLKALSGNGLAFFTGICMISRDTGEMLEDMVRTDILMKKLSEGDINRYLENSDHYLTCALGFDPLGQYSMTFIRQITGSYNNVLRGVPMERVVEMLDEIGFEF